MTRSSNFLSGPPTTVGSSRIVQQLTAPTMDEDDNSGYVVAQVKALVREGCVDMTIPKYVELDPSAYTAVLDLAEDSRAYQAAEKDIAQLAQVVT